VPEWTYAQGNFKRRPEKEEEEKKRKGILVWVNECYGNLWQYLSGNIFWIIKGAGC